MDSIVKLRCCLLVYASTNGDNWLWESTVGHWNFTNPNVNPCINQWAGIDCYAGCSNITTSTCIIANITLEDYNMVGTLPE